MIDSWEAFFGSAMDAGDEFSDTISQGSLRSNRSIFSRRQQPQQQEQQQQQQQPSISSTKSPGTPTAGGAPRGFVAPTASIGKAIARVGGSGVGVAARVGEDRRMSQLQIPDGASEVSRDVGGLELDEGWDEKFVYKVCFFMIWFGLVGLFGLGRFDFV